MAEYEFLLVGSGELSEETLNALYEAGCSDTTFSECNGVVYADVSRDAPDFFTAARSAIENIESVGTVRLEGLDAGHLVAMADIAERLGRSRESIRLLIAGHRGRGGFPPPTYRLHDRTRLWVWSHVARWAEQELAVPADPREVEVAEVADAINAALAMRRDRGRLSEEQRRNLCDLVEA